MQTKKHSNCVGRETVLIIWKSMRDADYKNIKEHGGAYRHYSTEGYNHIDPNHWSNKLKTQGDGR